MPLFPWAAGTAKFDAVRAARSVAQLAAHAKVHEAFEWFRSHEREIATFQLDITAIAAPPFAEDRRAEFFLGALAQLGYDAQRDDVGNVIARVGDTTATPALAISAHLDTVFPAETKLDIRRDHTRLLGPGISDNGAGLAALWALAALMKDCGLRVERPVMFIGNVGEEGDGNLRGVRHIFSDPTMRAAIGAMLILDGAGVDSIVAEALGSRRFEVRVTGPGGHSWSDYGVPNPIVALARTVNRLAAIPLPTSHKTTINVGTITGGTSVNTIPELAMMRIDVRSSEVADIERIERTLHECVREAVNESQAPRSIHKHLQYEIKVVGDRPAAELRLEAPILQAIKSADSHLGIRSRVHRASTDANIPLSLGIDAVAIGAGGSGGGAHTLHEWFDPIGRDLGLKRILLAVLLLAGFDPVTTNS